jgi:DHA2 family multidrug resistance protein
VTSRLKKPSHRWPLSITIMLAIIMNSLDTTIANVALPHLQGSISASQEQITWVLTSYIVGGVVATPLTGWAAARIGPRRLFLVAIVGFTLASMLCGISMNLTEIVGFRLAQGMFGALLMPLSQTVMLDITPAAERGQSMGLWGAGTMLGPVLGPALGGFLTDQLSWRWVFYINVPVGILAVIGLLMFMDRDDRDAPVKRFDFLGFGALTLFIGGFQLMLDRGPSLDWFASPEVCVEALIALVGAWVFLIHTMTTPHPFFDRSLIRDRNFVMATVFAFIVGMLLFSTLALLPPMMQTLLGYPVLTSGLVNMPRGVGSMVSMLVVGQLIGRLDNRLVMAMGFGLCSFSLWQMAQFDLTMPAGPIMAAGLLQGFGIGLMFVPLTTLAFATLTPELRGEGASVFNLVRGIGSGAGISIMNALVVANTQTLHAAFAARIDPGNPVVAADLGARLNLSSSAGLAALDGEINRQAAMAAYLDDFRLMFVMTLVCMPFLLLMRPPRGQAIATETAHEMPG